MFYSARNFLILIIGLFVLAGCAGEITDLASLNEDNKVGVAQPQTPSILPGERDAYIARGAVVNRRDAKFKLMPIEGAPGNTSDKLSRRILSEAALRQITIIRHPDEIPDFLLHARLISTGDDTLVTIVYVLELVDGTGSVVHRIVGQENADGTNGDPWSAATSEALANIALRTVAILDAWINESAQNG